MKCAGCKRPLPQGKGQTFAGRRLCDRCVEKRWREKEREVKKMEGKP